MKLISLRDSRRGNWRLDQLETSRLRGFEASRLRGFEASRLRGLDFHQNCVKMVHDTLRCLQNGIRYVKMSSRSHRICPQSRPRKPPVAIMHIFATFFEVQLGGHGANKRGKERTAGRSDRKPSPKQALSEAFRRRKRDIFD